MITSFQKFIGKCICPAQKISPIKQTPYDSQDTLHHDTKITGQALKIFFPGNAYRIDDPKDLGHLNVTHVVNWPHNRDCKSANELLEHVIHDVNNLISNNSSIESIELVGHSLGGHAALKCALNIQDNPKINIKVTTINTFTSIVDAILEGFLSPLDYIVVTILTTLIAFCTLPLFATVKVLISCLFIRLVYPKILRVPIASIVNLAGWNMDNSNLIEQLVNKNIPIQFKQANSDLLIPKNAQLAQSRLKDSNCIDIKHYIGDHNSIR